MSLTLETHLNPEVCLWMLSLSQNQTLSMHQSRFRSTFLVHTAYSRKTSIHTFRVSRRNCRVKNMRLTSRDFGLRKSPSLKTWSSCVYELSCWSSWLKSRMTSNTQEGADGCCVSELMTSSIIWEAISAANVLTSWRCQLGKTKRKNPYNRNIHWLVRIKTLVVTVIRLSGSYVTPYQQTLTVNQWVEVMRQCLWFAIKDEKRGSVHGAFLLPVRGKQINEVQMDSKLANYIPLEITKKLNQHHTSTAEHTTRGE